MMPTNWNITSTKQISEITDYIETLSEFPELQRQQATVAVKGCLNAFQARARGERHLAPWEQEVLRQAVFTLLPYLNASSNEELSDMLGLTQKELEFFLNSWINTREIAAEQAGVSIH